MRKAISLAMTMCILFGTLSILSINTSAYKCGDLNNDGKINAIDASLMSIVIIGGETTNLALKTADFNGDTKVNSTDDNLMRQFFVGKYLYDPMDVNVGEINILGKDLSEYDILCPGDADDCMKYTADTLSQYIYDACGIKPDIVEKKNNNPVIQLLKDTTSTEDIAGVLGNEGYHVYVSDGDVVIEGGIYNGCMHGMYDFLRQYLGFVFYYPVDGRKETFDDDAEKYVYDNERIVIDNIELSHMPSFQSRLWFGNRHYYSPAMAYNGEFYSNNEITRLKYGGYGAFNVANHGIIHYYTEAEMNADSRGYKYNKQPCFTSEKVINHVIEGVLNELDTKVEKGLVPGKNITHVDVAQIDGFVDSFCMCRTCKTALREEGYHSGAVLRFANLVDDAIQSREEYRGKIYTEILAYTGTIHVPNITRPNDMIMISYCFYIDEYNICANHSIADENCYMNKTFIERFEEWCALTDNIMVWYYPLNFYYYASTSPITFNIYDDMKYLFEHNVFAIYICGSDTNTSFGHLNFYLIERMMWDSEITREEFYDMMKEYLFVIYGDGYESVYEYLEILEEAGDRAPGTNNTGHWCTFHTAPMAKMDMSYINDNADRIMELYENASSMTKTDEEYMAVEKIFIDAHYLVACATHTDRWLNGTEEERAEYKEIIDYYIAHAKEYDAWIADDANEKQVCIEPNIELDYDINPFELMKEVIDPGGERFGGGFGGWSNDYNY